MFDFRFESDTSFFFQKDENVDSSKKRKKSTSFSRIFILKHAWFHLTHVITKHLI